MLGSQTPGGSGEWGLQHVCTGCGRCLGRMSGPQRASDVPILTGGCKQVCKAVELHTQGLCPL